MRMESEIRKQYIAISGTPVLIHTLNLFTRLKQLQHMVLVIPEEDREYCLENIVAPDGLNEKVCMVSGGTDRQKSVMNGLKKVREISSSSQSCLNSSILNSSCSEDSDKRGGNSGRQSSDRLKIVLIHDGVRPFVDCDIITRCIAGAVEYGACIPVIPVSDTLKQMDGRGFVAGSVDRRDLYQVQTPQAFELDLIIDAHEQALLSGFSATDDASLVEKLGKKVFMTSGSGRNIKITTREDLLLAEYMVSTGVTGYYC